MAKEKNTSSLNKHLAALASQAKQWGLNDEDIKGAFIAGLTIRLAEKVDRPSPNGDLKQAKLFLKRLCNSILKV